jgi:hypothetical protein
MIQPPHSEIGLFMAHLVVVCRQLARYDHDIAFAICPEAVTGAFPWTQFVSYCCTRLKHTMTFCYVLDYLPYADGMLYFSRRFWNWIPKMLHMSSMNIKMYQGPCFNQTLESINPKKTRFPMG